MVSREEVKVEFAGLAHDHLRINRQQQQQQQDINSILCNSPANNRMMPLNKQSKQMMPPSDDSTHNHLPLTNLSTIAILKRHPMYDSLVLVKRFRECLNGYSLEFPTSEDKQNNSIQDEKTTTTTMKNMQQQNDDCYKTKLVTVYLDGDDPIFQCREPLCKSDINSSNGEVVYVPINGLLDRLDNYDKHGISVDSRVYAFAMGLKTAEKFLTSSSMKEIQETPPI